MKTSYISAVAFFGMQALAFPPNLMDREIPEEEMRQLSQLAARIAEENSAVKRDSLGKRLGFDAEKQLVSISGDHEFVSSCALTTMNVANAFTDGPRRW